MEKGEVLRNTQALGAAGDILDQLSEQFPNFSQLSPLGYVQNRLHRLRFSALAERKPDEMAADIQHIIKLVNRGAYAHEFLELEEVCEQYGILTRLSGLNIAYHPDRPRFGQKRLNRLRPRVG
jgi:hypothetical protein